MSEEENTNPEVQEQDKSEAKAKPEPKGKAKKSGNALTNTASNRMEIGAFAVNPGETVELSAKQLKDNYLMKRLERQVEVGRMEWA